jgi:amino acid adenylation domain-containing protein
MTFDHRTVPARFKAVAGLNPDRTALVTLDETVSYGELSARVADAHAGLVAAGVQPGECVAVHLERSIDTVVILLAVMSAGAHYLYLDPAFGPDRLSAMADDADVVHQVVERDAVVAEAEVLEVAKVMAGGPPCDVAAHANALAYVKFTSGSTGRAKGVPVSHDNLAGFLAAMDTFLAVHRPVRWLAAAALSFDVSVFDLFWPLTRGHTVALNTERLLSDTALEAMTRHVAPTHLQVTPTLARHLLASAAGRRGLGQLDHLMIGGEHLPSTLAADLLRVIPGRVTNIYGPTETTVWATGQDLAEPLEPITVGTPFDRVLIDVVDEERQPVAAGEIGELLIGGPMVTAGYLKRPELTPSRFFTRSGLGDERWYATGDLARVLPDGRIELHGRTDHQVKVRGVRVELGEVEAGLERHPAVAQAVVIPRAGANGETTLHAYAVAVDPSDPPSPQDVLALARRHLLPATVPPRLDLVESFPLTATGKVDRTAMAIAAPPTARPAPQGAASRACPADAVVQAADAVVNEVCRLMAAVLSIPHVEPDADFFALGGNSLQAVRLMHEIETRHQVRLAVSLMAEAPTARLLAALVRTRPATRSLVVLEAAGEGAPLVLVHGQAGNVLAFRSLAAELTTAAGTSQRPILAFQAYGVDGGGQPDATIEAMARRYVDELVEHRPHGPYVLSGYSAGGAVALEMAVQLEALDRSVLGVLLLDADCPALDPLTSRERLELVAARLRREGLTYGGQWVIGKAQRWRADKTEAAAHAQDAVGAALADRTVATITAALASAQLRAPSAPVTLIRARELAITSPDDLGWRQVLGGQLPIVWVPGDHRTMFEPPHVAALAGVLQRQIAAHGG